jgi:heme a synthase
MNFKRFGILTIVFVYLLIFVGGIVRSTGSGMGCPDWPKCFGMWVPPTSIDQLPINYQEIYGAKLKGEVIFNPTKTWIEYLNRLLGALIGIFIFVTFLFSLKYLRTSKSTVIWSGIGVLLTGIQGYIGSKVVSMELAEFMVSIHMLIAIIIVFVLIYALHTAGIFNKIRIKTNQKLKFIWIVFFLTFLQVILGTQVREQIDMVAVKLGESLRYKWVENIGWKFLVHRSFSLIVLGAHLYLLKGLIGLKHHNNQLTKITNWLLAVVLTEIVTGVVLNYLSFPAFIQPIHLTLAIVSLGLQMIIILALNNISITKASVQ